MDYTVVREHRGTGNHGCWSNPVYPDMRAELDGQLSNQVIQRRLADVVGLASLLGYQGVG